MPVQRRLRRNSTFRLAEIDERRIEVGLPAWLCGTGDLSEPSAGQLCIWDGKASSGRRMFGVQLYGATEHAKRANQRREFDPGA